MKTGPYDIFVSYRRASGSYLAKNIHDWLLRHKYRPFMDIEDLRSGAFNTKLYETIGATEDFLVILTPGSLDRCWNEGDWVRLEIAHAIRCRRNIIPVIDRHFTPPAELPADIAGVMNYGGIEPDIEVFDAHMQRLCDRFLHSRPHTLRAWFSGRRVTTPLPPGVEPPAARSPEPPPAADPRPTAAIELPAPVRPAPAPTAEPTAPVAPSRAAADPRPARSWSWLLRLPLLPFKLMGLLAQILRRALFDEAGQLRARLNRKRRRTLRAGRRLGARINAFEAEYQNWADGQLRSVTASFRERMARGDDLDALLPEAFAAVKNACRRLCGTSYSVCGKDRTWDQVPVDAQILAGIVLYQGGIADMTLGQGNLLAAALPLYLHALGGRNPHYMTASAYQARRDSDVLSHLFGFLGLTVGCINSDLRSGPDAHAPYACDVTCGTALEFGFDYLRDHAVAQDVGSLRQRRHDVAIVNDADEIFIAQGGMPLQLKDGANVCIAEITIRNVLRLYDRIAGITCSVGCDAAELGGLFGLHVVPIPQDQPDSRTVTPDQILRTQREKLNAVIEDVRQRYQQGQPVLVGTVRQDEAELVSRMLKRQMVPHNFLPTSDPSGCRDADVLARAGHAGAVTVLSDLAGRGTEIEVDSGVVGLGGLHIIGCGRATRRYRDNQLIARGGAACSSCFYISLEDELMRLNNGNRMAGIMHRMGMEEGETLANPWLTRSIASAQRRITAYEITVHKARYAYDDVLDDQRRDVYALRALILPNATAEVASAPVSASDFMTGFSMPPWFVLLAKLDRVWPEHLAGITALREGLNGRDLGKGDALSTYRKEAGELFEKNVSPLKAEFARLEESANEQAIAREQESAREQELAGIMDTWRMQEPVRREVPVVGRNDPCPCGSGKRFKACCGASPCDPVRAPRKTSRKAGGSTRGRTARPAPER